jgi:uncharacterized protein YsxB (DUF464 family)
MVVVHAVVARGMLRSLRVEGHATIGEDGVSAACAVVSAATKALGLALTGNRSCSVTGDVVESGVFTIDSVRCRDRRWTRGAWDVARRAFLEAAEAWPHEVRVTIVEE